VNNLRYALRLLAKNPGFTVVAVLTLALGIGVNSGIFSIVDAVMLRPLSYPQPGRLVSVWETLTGEPPSHWSTSNSGPNPRVRMPVSIANLADYQKQNHAFLGIAGEEIFLANLTETGAPERIVGERVTTNFFSTLQVPPAQGRGFLQGEDSAGGERVVVLSYELWQRKFGLDQNWASNSITLDGEKYRIVGIMAAGFESPMQLASGNKIGFYIPGGYSVAAAADHGTHQVSAFARLNPDVTLARAQSEMDAISAELDRSLPASNHNVKTAMGPMSADVVREARPLLLVMLGAVGLVLLIACTNLANLLLARAAGRQREITIRFALGASRRRVVGELLTQSLLLGALGSVAGLLFGAWTRELLVKFAPGGIPRLDSAGIDARVLLFTLALSLLTGLLFGLAPALQASKARPVETMKSTERGAAGASVMRLRSVLMSAEIAISMILLVGAGLLIRSFVSLSGIDVGFNTEHVLAMRIDLPEKRYGAPGGRLAFFEDLATRVGALPGVQSVGFANRMPMRGGWDSDLDMDDGSNPESDMQSVSPSYFPTLGIPLLRGRLIAETDRANSMLVAVVNKQFAHSILRDRDPIGRRFRWGPSSPWITIVGVVGDIRRGGKAKEIAPEAYLPAAQPTPSRLSDFAFRAAGDPKQLVAAVQQQVWAIDKDQPVTQVRTLEEVISQAASERRFQTTLLAMFAGLALLLALVGVYGVISYAVSQRTNEIGLRIALGAQRSDILRMVIGKAMLLVIVGIAAGAAGAFALSRYLTTLLFHIKPSDPLTYSALAALLSLVALLACYVPARRATRVDPMIALRYE
jgi:putative ABC transport system permease protein